MWKLRHRLAQKQLSYEQEEFDQMIADFKEVQGFEGNFSKAFVGMDVYVRTSDDD